MNLKWKGVFTNINKRNIFYNLRDQIEKFTHVNFGSSLLYFKRICMYGIIGNHDFVFNEKQNYMTIEHRVNNVTRLQEY